MCVCVCVGGGEGGVPEEETGRTVRHNKRDIVPNCVIEVIIQVLSKTNNFFVP